MMACKSTRADTRINMLGCHIDNLTMEETLSKIGSIIGNGGSHQHVVVNVDKIVKANRNPVLREIINRCDLINADGMPVVWGSKLLGKPLKARVTGIDLFTKLLEYSARAGWRVFFFGAREHVVSKIVTISQERHPDLTIAGYRNGYWQAEDERSVVEAIKRARPDILFVAISSPKKEEFLGRYLEEMGISLAMGVGGSFDVIAGLTKRAPLWMQKSGLEWFHRFLQEPRRMFKRYFVEDMYFFLLLAKALLRKHRLDSQEYSPRHRESRVR